MGRFIFSILLLEVVVATVHSASLFSTYYDGLQAWDKAVKTQEYKNAVKAVQQHNDYEKAKLYYNPNYKQMYENLADYYGRGYNHDDLKKFYEAWLAAEGRDHNKGPIVTSPETPDDETPKPIQVVDEWGRVVDQGSSDNNPIVTYPETPDEDTYNPNQVEGFDEWGRPIYGSGGSKPIVTRPDAPNENTYNPIEVIDEWGRVNHGKKPFVTHPDSPNEDLYGPIDVVDEWGRVNPDHHEKHYGVLEPFHGTLFKEFGLDKKGQVDAKEVSTFYKVKNGRVLSAVNKSVIDVAKKH